MTLNIWLPVIEIIIAPGYYITIIKRWRLRKALLKIAEEERKTKKISKKNKTGYTQH